MTGYSRSAETRKIAAEIDLCEVMETAAEAVVGADLVILCVPVGAMGAAAKEIAPYLKEGAIVSDVGSVKTEVIEAVYPHLGDRFIPAHPIAGTEHSGPRAGFAELFDGRWLLLTPLENSSKQAVAALRKFWEEMGSDVDEMDPQHHDLVLAVTSHAPHLIAFTMVGVADDLGRVTSSEVVNYSAAGFRDFTRIAASDPTMWRDIFLNNRDAVLEVLGRFNEDLSELQRAVRRGDGDKLHRLFSSTRDVRRGILELGQDRKRKPSKK